MLDSSSYSRKIWSSLSFISPGCAKALLLLCNFHTRTIIWHYYKAAFYLCYCVHLQHVTELMCIAHCVKFLGLVDRTEKIMFYSCERSSEPSRSPGRSLNRPHCLPSQTISLLRTYWLHSNYQLHGNSWLCHRRGEKTQCKSELCFIFNQCPALYVLFTRLANVD